MTIRRSPVVVYLTMYRVLYIPGGARLLIHQQYDGIRQEHVEMTRWPTELVEIGTNHLEKPQKTCVRIFVHLSRAVEQRSKNHDMKFHSSSWLIRILIMVYLTWRMEPWNKSLNFIFPTKYVIPKSLKFSHWPSKLSTSPLDSIIPPKKKNSKELQGFGYCSVTGAVSEPNKKELPS